MSCRMEDVKIPDKIGDQQVLVKMVAAPLSPADFSQVRGALDSLSKAWRGYLTLSQSLERRYIHHPSIGLWLADLWLRGPRIIAGCGRK